MPFTGIFLRSVMNSLSRILRFVIQSTRGPPIGSIHVWCYTSGDDCARGLRYATKPTFGKQVLTKFSLPSVPIVKYDLSMQVMSSIWFIYCSMWVRSFCIASQLGITTWRHPHKAIRARLQWRYWPISLQWLMWQLVPYEIVCIAHI